MKPCKRCGKIKPLSEFYSHKMMADGHLSFCKTCKKSEARTNYGENITDVEWLKEERLRCRIKMDAYRKSGRAKPTTQAAREAWAKKNPEKIRAQRLANYAIRIGHIKKRKVCSKCGADGKRMEKHHPDYDKPLDVVWLCATCHAKERILP